MARQNALQRIARFSTANPAELARQLSLFEQNLHTKLFNDDQLEFGPLKQISTTSIKDPIYSARPWDVVLYDSSSTAGAVVLPAASDARARNSWVGVKLNSDSTNTVSIVAVNSLIDSQPSFVCRMPRGFYWFFSDGNEWKRGPSTSEFGAPRVLDTKYAPVGLWNMHLGAGIGIKDYSGNGNDMVVETGTLRYSALHPKLGGVLFDGATNAFVNGSPAVLQVTGALTLLVLAMWSDLPTGTNVRTFVMHGANGAGGGSPDINNYLYRFSVDLNNQCQYFSQHGAKVNDVFTNNTFSPRSQVALLGLTRSSGGVLNFWYNGSAVGSSFGTTTMPNGGSNGKCRIGGGAIAAEASTSVISSVGVYAAELNSTQMLERYNYSLGPAYGYR